MITIMKKCNNNAISQQWDLRNAGDILQYNDTNQTYVCVHLRNLHIRIYINLLFKTTP